MEQSIATERDFVSSIIEYNNTIRDLERTKSRLTHQLLERYCPFKVGDVVRLSIATPSYKTTKIGKILGIDVSFSGLSAVYNYVIYEYDMKYKKELHHRRIYYHPEYTEIRLLERNGNYNRTLCREIT